MLFSIPDGKPDPASNNPDPAIGKPAAVAGIPAGDNPGPVNKNGQADQGGVILGSKAKGGSTAQGGSTQGSGSNNAPILPGQNIGGSGVR